MVKNTYLYITKRHKLEMQHFYFNVKSILHIALINSFIIFKPVNILTPFVMDMN